MSGRSAPPRADPRSEPERSERLARSPGRRRHSSRRQSPFPAKSGVGPRSQRPPPTTARARTHPGPARHPPRAATPADSGGNTPAIGRHSWPYASALERRATRKPAPPRRRAARPRAPRRVYAERRLPRARRRGGGPLAARTGPAQTERRLMTTHPEGRRHHDTTPRSTHNPRPTTHPRAEQQNRSSPHRRPTPPPRFTPPTTPPPPLPPPNPRRRLELTHRPPPNLTNPSVSRCLGSRLPPPRPRPSSTRLGWPVQVYLDGRGRGVRREAADPPSSKAQAVSKGNTRGRGGGPLRSRTKPIERNGWNETQGAKPPACSRTHHAHALLSHFPRRDRPSAGRAWDRAAENYLRENDENDEEGLAEFDVKTLFRDL
jgi:hypothetical protein